MISSIDPLLQTFWIIAIISSVFYIIHLINKYSSYKPIHYFQNYFNLAPQERKENKEDGNLITLNVFFTFMLFLGWSGVIFSTFITNRLSLLFIALVIGFMALFFVRKRRKPIV